MNLRDKKIHLVGIGGIGMSGLGFVLAEMGCRISGSDLEGNSIIKKMRKKNITVTIGHAASSVKDPDIVVYSSSIRQDNPELQEARRRKIHVIPRMELLKMVIEQNKRKVAILGSHGKTTITAMSGFLLEKSGFDPTVLIGGVSPHFEGNAKLGKKKTVVAEVDESDGRFPIIKATHILSATLERDHAEYYRDEAHLLDVFKKFIRAQSVKSAFFYRFEDVNLREIAGIARGRTVSFGFSEKADVLATNIKIGIYKTDFDCFHKKNKIGHFTLNIPGIHNVTNALAVISLGIDLGLESEVIKYVISAYRGVKRRFEIIGDVRGAKIVEDYAHHPTEIRATIQAAYSTKPKRLITVFQPHRYTRTKAFCREFSSSFGGSDEVILTEVYSASEDKIEGVSIKNIYDIMARENSVPVKLLDKDRIPGYLARKIKKGDLVLIMGAGDIGKTAHALVSRLRR